MDDFVFVEVVEAKKNLDENVHDKVFSERVGIIGAFVNLIKPLLDVEAEITN